MSKHAISIHENIVKSCKCILCEFEVNEKVTHIFHINEYNENAPPLQHLLQNRTSDNINGRICKNCHSKPSTFIQLLNANCGEKKSKGTVHLS